MLSGAVDVSWIPSRLILHIAVLESVPGRGANFSKMMFAPLAYLFSVVVMLALMVSLVRVGYDSWIALTIEFRSQPSWRTFSRIPIRSVL